MDFYDLVIAFVIVIAVVWTIGIVFISINSSSMKQSQLQVPIRPYTEETGLMRITAGATSGWGWYVNDQLHRLDGPAVMLQSGEVRWYTNDQCHRTNGPAVFYPDGTQAWYFNGTRHRTDGPAVLYPDGTQSWYYNDKRHRTDGPAVTHATGQVEYWVNGRQLSEYEMMFIINKENT